MKIPGIHHVTAIAGDPDRNLDFYTRVMGLRLVKLTVNFDDPGTYHFYFGDENGDSRAYSDVLPLARHAARAARNRTSVRGFVFRANARRVGRAPLKLHGDETIRR